MKRTIFITIEYVCNHVHQRMYKMVLQINNLKVLLEIFPWHNISAITIKTKYMINVECEVKFIQVSPTEKKK